MTFYGSYMYVTHCTATGTVITTETSPCIKSVSGPIMSEVVTDLPNVRHKLRLYNSPGLDGSSIDISNIVDIRQESNAELSMRVVTDVDNKDNEFFTDLNGYQVCRDWSDIISCYGF